MYVDLEKIITSIRCTGADVRPDEISSIMGLRPCKAWAKGDAYMDVTGSKRRRYNGLWLYNLPGCRSALPSVHLRRAINALEGVQFRHLRNGGDVRIDLCLWIEAVEKSWNLATELVKQVHDIGLDGIHLSFIGLGTDALRAWGPKGKTIPTMQIMQIIKNKAHAEKNFLAAQGVMAEDMEQYLDIFIRNLYKSGADFMDPCYLKIKWEVPHGSLSISSKLVKPLLHIGCSRICFLFRNV